MRRKKRYGVYSNRTIKKCFCNINCRQCKGACKTYFPNQCDPDTNWHGYFEPSRNKLHQKGTGSLMPGRKFVQYDKNHSKTYRYLRDMYEKYKRLHKRELKELASEEYENHHYYLS